MPFRFLRLLGPATRCFVMRENMLSWGSKAAAGDRAVSLEDIVDISIQPLPGAPEGSDVGTPVGGLVGSADGLVGTDVGTPVG